MAFQYPSCSCICAVQIIFVLNLFLLGTSLQKCLFAISAAPLKFWCRYGSLTMAIAEEEPTWDHTTWLQNFHLTSPETLEEAKVATKAKFKATTPKERLTFQNLRLPMLGRESETGEQAGSFLLGPGLGTFWPQCVRANLFESSLPSFFPLFGFTFFSRLGRCSPVKVFKYLWLLMFN